MSSKQPIRLREAAKRLGISKQAALQRIDTGKLDAYRDDRGHWWVPWPPDDALVAEVVGEVVDEVAREPEPPAVVEQPSLSVSLSPLVDELSALRETLDRQQAVINRLAGLVEQQQVGQQSRDQWIVQQVRETLEARREERRPWWKKMLGR